MASQKKTSCVAPYPAFKTHEYFEEINAQLARMYFPLRKNVHKYDDGVCRLSKASEEDVDHIEEKEVYILQNRR